MNHAMIVFRGMLALAVLLAGPVLAQHDHGRKKRPPPLAIGAAFSPSGELWVVGLDAKLELFVQTSADEGRQWSAPRALDTGGDKPVADGENRPKLAFGPTGQAVISYTVALARPYTGQIRMLRSDDGGRSFSPPFTVHQDRQIITHRFESLAFDGQGTLHTLWVDKRDAAAAAAALPQARWWRCGGTSSIPVPPQRSSATTLSRQWRASLRRLFAPVSTTGPSKPARTMAPGWRLRLAAATTRCGLATVPAKPWFATGVWVPMVRRSVKPGRCLTNRPSMPQCRAQAPNW